MTSQPAMTTLLTRLRHWRDDHRGVAAVEFAIVLPFMLTLYIGGVELGDGMAIQLKVTDTAHIVADLTTQQTTTVTAATVQRHSGRLIGDDRPLFAVQPRRHRLGSEHRANGVATVTWSQSLNGTKRTAGQTMTLPALAGRAAEYFADPG